VSKVLQQGQADGLCGLYALMHFLNRTDWKENPQKALWYLLDACRHFGWLTPQHLTEGLEDHQLKAILDLQITNYRLEFKTYFLEDAFLSAGAQSYREFLEKVVSAGGSAIAQNQNGGHWVLVTKGQNGAEVVDSANYENPRAPLCDRRLSEQGWGIVILPSSRAKVEIDL